MSMNTKLGRALVAGAALMMVFPMTGCRKKMADESTGIKAEILYQTYCEDSFKGYQMDNTAALTFYTDGTWSTAHCNGLNNYRTDIGTWEVSDDGVLSMYNADGELVGNGSDSVDPSDVTTWTKWGAGYFNNGDGTETQYDSTYCFAPGENGDFTFTNDDQTYFYWGSNAHISSQYASYFTAQDFLDAYNAKNSKNLTSLTENWGTASPLSEYEHHMSDYMAGDIDMRILYKSWGLTDEQIDAMLSGESTTESTEE